MPNNFIQAMGSSGLTHTENNALTHAGTGSAILDWFFHGAALRDASEGRITYLFEKAFREDPTTALRILFYIRDARGGQGERRVFRTCLTWLATEEPEWLIKNLSIIPHYGRWDDLWVLLDSKFTSSGVLPKTMKLIRDTIASDLKNIYKNENISLISKWLPSINTSSPKSRNLAKKIVEWMYLSPSDYRRMLSSLRSYLNVVEIKMSANKWNKINYSEVPSQASRLYRKAFNRHDKQRYQKYLEDVEKGNSKINTGTLYPYQIVAPFISRWNIQDKTLEMLWKNLPDYVEDIHGLVVADTSASMNGRPMEVSVSLAMYIAERNKNKAFKDYFISFSHEPKFHKITGSTLSEKCGSIMLGDVANTDLIKVFKLILDRSTQGKVSQEDMPKVLFIVSDMEFDQATDNNTTTNFEEINLMYAQHGYTPPKLIFWNVDSRQNQSPVQVHNTGTLLISGCSPTIFKYALMAANDPMDIVNSVVNNERYVFIDYSTD